MVSAVALSARLGRPVSAEHRARLSAVDWAGLPDASDLQAAVADFLAQWRADPEQAGAALFEAVLGWRRGAAMARRRAQPFDWELRRDCGHG